MIDKILKDVKDALKIDSPKEFMIGWLPYILIFYLGNIFAKHVNAYVGGDIIDRIFTAILQIETMSFLPSLKANDLATGLVVAGIVKAIVYTKGKKTKKFREGEEYGSARWN